MKHALPSLATATLLSLLLFFSYGTQAQILVQDYEELLTVQDWSNISDPSLYQVNTIENKENVYFELGSEGGDQFLKLVKAMSGQHNQVASFYRRTNFPTQELLQIQFDLAVSSAQNVKGVIGSFYLGQNLEGKPLYPVNANRFATININFEGGTAFSLTNVYGQDQQTSSGTYAGDARITIVLNNTASPASYQAPDGEIAEVGSKKISVWVGSQQAIENANAHAAPGVELQAFKFSSRNNGLEGVLMLDNLLVEPLRVRTQKPALTTAGGSFTVGTGGDFASLTNPGGVFEALNALQGSITGSFVFKIVGDLVRETGEISLDELSGASSTNTILFQPKDNARVYTISGDNKAEQGALITLNGADWVVFDGRAAGDASQGISVSRHLLLRNAGTAASLQFQNDATHDLISYMTIQGASNTEKAGVVYLGDGAATGNDANAFIYNRIGGYGQQQPLNALASANSSDNHTEDILIRGNQFYSFGHVATLTQQMPCALIAGEGSSRWQVLENHFFQESDAGPIPYNGEYAIQGVCINAGTNHLVQDNFVGGTAIDAAGGYLRASSSGTAGSYPSIVPFRVDAPEGTVDIIGNTVKNIAVTGNPFILCDALALGSLALAGEVNFTDNTFGDPLSSDTPEIIARTTSSGSNNMGGYQVAPIYYRAATGRQVKGKVVGNKIGSVLLEGSFDGAGTADLTFTGILTNPTAELSQLSDNIIANISTEVSGNIGVSITGIHSLGIGATIIERNVLYSFYNGAPTASLGCVGVLPSQDPAVTGIIVDHQSTSGSTEGSDVLVANNMISFEATEDLSSGFAVYYGIMVPSNMLGSVNVYYNSVYIWGANNQARGRNFVFYRKGTAPTQLRNNIFLNTRKTDKPNFIIGSASGGFDSDYNLIFQKTGSTLRDFGFYGPGGIPDDSNDASRFAATCEEWMRISGQDLNSLCVNMENFFVDPSTGNLRILQTGENPVVDKGIEVDAVKVDIDLMLRIVPDIGASEALNAWIGVVSTNWFDSRNWSTAKVPSCENDNLLTILPKGTPLPKHLVSNSVVEKVVHQPVLDGGVSMPRAVYRNLQVQEGAEITIAGEGAHLEQCGVLNPAQEGLYNAGAITYTAAGTITLVGVLANDGIIQAPMGTFVLGGAEDQLINSTAALTFWNLSISGGGAKLVSTPVLVKNSLQLDEGIYSSDQSNSLTLDVDAFVTGTPTNATHIAGPMTKNFSGPDQEFLYPLGDAGRLGLMALQTVEGEAQQYPVSFTARYFVRTDGASDDLPPADLLHDDVHYVSDFDVWQVSRETEGMASAHIALYYHDQTGIEDVEDAAVVRWEASNPGPGWTMAGESTLQEGIPTGYGERLLSEPVQDLTFFTLGIPEDNEGLPVELVNFAALAAGQDVQLTWQTTMEKNSNYFAVERSLDGFGFQAIGQVEAAGNSQKSLFYAYTDGGVGKEHAGTIYYRLKQVDIDGSIEYSPMVAVQLADQVFAIMGVYPNPFAGQLSLKVRASKTQQLDISLLNMEGRRLYSRKIIIRGSETLTPLLNVEQLQAGMYILEVRSALESRQFKVIKQ